MNDPTPLFERRERLANAIWRILAVLVIAIVGVWVVSEVVKALPRDEGERSVTEQSVSSVQ